LRDEEEQLGLADIEVVRNEHRASQAEAGDVISVTAARQAGDVIEEIVGVELFVPVGPPAGAVELLGAALGNHRDRAARIAAELGLVVRSQNLDFGDGVDVRLEVGETVAAAGVYVADPVHHETRDAGAAVEGETPQDASAGRIPPHGGVHHAGKHAHVTHHLAASDGLAVELVAFNNGGPFGGGGLDRSHLGGHRDLLRDVADVEGQAPQIPVLAEAHNNVFDDPCLETIGLDADTVGGRKEVGESENSRTVGCRRARGGGSLVCQLDFHIRNHRARRICHDTDQRTGDRLSK